MTAACADEAGHGPAEPLAALCEGCLRRSERDLAALTCDYVGLEALLPSSPVALRTRVTGRREAPSPLSLGVDALQRSIHAAVTAVEPAVREAARLSPEVTANVRHGWAVKAAVDVMAPRTALISTLAGQWGYLHGPEGEPVFWDGCEALRLFRRLHGRARAVLGVRELVHRLPGECSGCGLEALRRRDGSDTVHCAGCHRLWTLCDYRQYVSLVLDTLDTPTKQHKA